MACSGGPLLSPHRQWQEPASPLPLHRHCQRAHSHPTHSPQALPAVPKPCIYPLLFMHFYFEQQHTEK